MIFTLLYKTSLFKENEHRNIYLYALGMVMYSAIHWLVFSSIGDKYTLVQKYRYILYAIATIDIIYVSHKYREFVKHTSGKTEKHKNSPKIEEVDDANSVVTIPIYRTQNVPMIQELVQSEIPKQEYEQQKTVQIEKVTQQIEDTPQNTTTEVTDKKEIDKVEHK